MIRTASDSASTPFCDLKADVDQTLTSGSRMAARPINAACESPESRFASTAARDVAAGRARRRGGSKTSRIFQHQERPHEHS